MTISPPLFTCPLDEEHAQRDAQLLKALADPTRLKIMALLKVYGGAITVEELVEALGNLAQPTISHHLRILRAANLITVEKDGLYHYYKSSLHGLVEAYGAVYDVVPVQWTRKLA